MRVLELFAGAGGAALGLERAGFEHAGLVEWDADACATLRAAGLGPVVEGDVSGLCFTLWAGVDAVWSSLPCQRHSRAGNGTGFDGWPDTLRCLRETRARWVMVENVEGAPIDEWCHDLEVLGYKTVAVRLLASDYGTPQDRARWFIVGGPVAVSVAGPSLALCSADSVVPAGWLRAEGVGACGRPTSRPAPTVTKAGNVYWYESDPGARMAGDKVTNGRRLTVEEGAALQGFPAGHPFQGTKSAQYRQVGNACPVTLTYVVGLAVWRANAALQENQDQGPDNPTSSIRLGAGQRTHS